MALTDSTTYYGEDAKSFYSQLLTSGVVKNEFTLLPGVKSKIKLASYDAGNVIQADTCDPSASGEGTLAQKSMEVCDLLIYLSFCELTFEQNYLSSELRAGSNNGELPDSFQRYVLQQVMKQGSADLEKILIHGDTATASYPYSKCDGLIKLLLADSDVIDVSATSSTISSTNVVTELNRVLDNTPAKVRAQEDFVILVSQEIAFAYKQAQAATTGGLFLVGDKELNYLGFRLVPTDALSAKQMIAFSKKNVFFLTDLVSDMEDLRVIPQKDITGARKVIVTGAFKAAVNYMFGEEIVLYSGGTVMA